ncbi:T-complex protein 11 [Citrus sinensis]|uniref:T-complex protein 11 n=1 Tax=Citrus sinensis TaxID=2711 RepID=A0ACB8KAR7_CITSI|nr:T-complex protein 11 [Citrus sinensis]
MMESSEGVRPAAGVAMEFPVSDEKAAETTSFSSATATRVPRRLRKRLLAECSKSPCTVEEIEAKLRHADLRRQQFYEKLSSKARPKPRSPPRSSSNEEDLGQRLEAKLQAAQQKRLSILAKAQKRLARLDELRQAAKTGVEMRFEKEREMLGSKVESRVQQAEANRMLILKAYSQRRDKLKERSSQSLLRRMTRESKYKERVRAAIHQKRLAAEKKRLGLLEAEKKKARARMLQVRRVAKFVSHQREVERRKMREQLEDRLQRAKRQRAEYLRQRARLHTVRVNWNRMDKQADVLSRKLARCWRQFLKHRRSTLELARSYDALKINEMSVKSLPFEQLALLIESTATLQTVKTLLERLESRFKIFRAVDAASNHSSCLDSIDHLLKRVASPKKRPTPRTPLRSREAKKVNSSREAGRTPAKLSRYPVRVVLCAYMILGHPDAVFSGQGEREIALAKSAEEFIGQFELLIKVILEGPIQSSDEESDSWPKRWTIRSQLAAFDKAWCSYLNCFVMWKVKDAKSLEDDLVRAACQLELSMIHKCKMTAEGDNGALTHDLKAIQKQVTEDQKLLREKVQHLSGDAGMERMECALSETRSKYFEAKENGSPIGSPITNFLSTSPPSSSAASASVTILDHKSNQTKGAERPNHVVRSLFREENPSVTKRIDSSASGTSSSGTSSVSGQLASSVERRSVKENEVIINEYVHNQHYAAFDIFTVNNEKPNIIKAKIRETMEKAFWDGIAESVKQGEHNYDRIIQLVREVRDEICGMAPQSWKEEITEAIDPEILSQVVLSSGSLDIDYLGRILEFALTTLQKLSAPANDDDMKANHQRLLKELAEICQIRDESNYSHVNAMIKGLRFVLEQIRALQQEIIRARMRMMEPFLKGPAGLEYLRKGFADRYGPPSDAHTSLPVTLQWLSSILTCKDYEWEEHKSSLSALVSQETSSGLPLPSTTLRTGGSFRVKTSGNQITSSHTSDVSNITVNQQPECKGERLDLMVRLGLLKLVSAITGITEEALPETLMLNLPRLRAVQAQIQKIIVISNSILVCRQTLLGERVVASPTDMEDVVSKCTERLLELLDHAEDAGIEEIVETISRFSSEDEESVNLDKLQLRKAVMARMLRKSLQAGDPIFERVSRAVYLAARGLVLGGTGPKGRKLAELALRKVGAATLIEKVVEAAEVLVVAANVSVSVHGPWYTNLTEKM